ncbi:circularly permuted type 2 ATP-grasp protein [Ammonicoccus fulvus]|uniref:Circularly permuted type 2 ATP-grasp protein n=1 Tax=Ammonicoccus fulvus TaxID=3138240 RepID=A0ABZ3FJW0_9ACTN
MTDSTLPVPPGPGFEDDLPDDRVSDAVDRLVTATAMLADYASPAADRAVDEAVGEGTPRPGYRSLLDAATALGPATLRERADRLRITQRAEGITFRPTADEEREFPLDFVPRLIPASDWQTIRTGCNQRARALDLFLDDVYGEQAIVRAGLIPEWMIGNAPGYRDDGRLATGVRAHVCGFDIVTAGDGRWQVLEDNLRIPSGLAYALWNRDLITRFAGEFIPPAPLVGHTGVAGTLLETLTRAAPPRCVGSPNVVLVTEGPENSAYAEHAELAARMGIPLIVPGDLLVVEEDRLARRTPTGTEPVDVIYQREVEETFLAATGADGRPLGDGIRSAVQRGTVTVANAFGNGVADDKAIYAFVPRMIEFYLGEQPILHNIPTYLCAEPDQLGDVLDNLGDLVTKPIDGHGGIGVVIGPDATGAELAARRAELLADPKNYVAQEAVTLSTLPAFDGEGFSPRHVDLRVFTHVRAIDPGDREAVTLPAALTRVAEPGSRIVNSSSGGGSKDTWILADPA